MFAEASSELAEDAADFLVSVRSDEGGFQANTRIPFADTLSTFTGLLTVVDLELSEVIDLRAVERYVLSLELPDGGFRGASWDQRADVEVAVTSARRNRGVSLLDLRVEHEDSVYPMIPAGSALHEMIRRPGKNPLVERPDDK